MSRYQSPRHRAADTIETLNPRDREQLVDILHYLGEHAGANGRGQMAEGSIASLVLRQNPAVRTALLALHDTITSPRDMPYQRKMSEAEIIDYLGGDVHAGLMAVAALDGMEVTGGLIGRMGDDSDLPAPPRTLKDDVTDALDAHLPEAVLHALGDAEIADAGAEADLTTRNTIEIIGQVKANSLGHGYEAETTSSDYGSLRNEIELNVALAETGNDYP